MASIAHFPFPIPLRATFVKRRRAIPTFGSRQAPRHESGYARHEYTRILALRKQLSYHPMFRRGIRLRRRRQVGRRAKQGALRSKVARARATQPPASLAVHPTATRPFPQRPQRLDSLARSRLWTGEDHAPQRSGGKIRRSRTRRARKRLRENINRRSFSKTAQGVAKVRQPKVKLGNLQYVALLTFLRHKW